MASLKLFLSTLELEIQISGADAAFATLDAVWQHASRHRYAPLRHHALFEVWRERRGFALNYGSFCQMVRSEEDVPVLLEGALYGEFLRAQRWHDLAVLHASACVYKGRPIVFFGQSGAGKSALARAAVERGLSYFGDEHIVTDGRELWGLPRTIHMDLHRIGDPLQPWHEGADMHAYRFRDRDGKQSCVPLFPLLDSSIAGTAAPVERLVLVALERGPQNQLLPLRAAEKISLLEQSTFSRAGGLVQIVAAPQSFRLCWSTPHGALEQLLGAVDAAG